ncbi:hypothetical protein [Azospira sp. I09]|uniref:hypothetical protein n=1 Tax=Azospira sp. I09 TaxID=1765049 RepID=UPI001260F1EC|nr:hypothetical protein [Azospira sp. I09]BBN90476.1 hypothetical protein AZSP09_34990 [Azospira sp. I09]
MNTLETQNASTVIDMATAVRERASIKVYANGNLVGEISIAEHEAFKLAAKNDRSLYREQALNYLEATFRLVGRIVLSIPENWFVIAVLLALMMPSEFNSLVSAIIANPSTSSTEFLNTVRWALAASIASTALVAVISGESFGLANVFDDRVAMMIRAKFKLPPMCKLFVDAEQILDGLPSHQAPTHFGK